jgi:competence protein ComFC
MGLIDLVFPKKCLRCAKSGRYLCERCISKVRFAKGECIECGKPAIDGMTHVKCLTPHAMDGSISIWEYAGVIRKAIIKLKYNFAYEIAEELADYIGDNLAKRDVTLPKDFILVPVPLHKKRKNWRGFNQVEEVGKILAKKMGWDYSDDILIRKKKTKPQVELKGDERKSNVLGVFALKPNYSLPIANYLLFDDVLTTGSTVREAGKVLKRNGAKSVWGLTIAS